MMYIAHAQQCALDHSVRFIQAWGNFMPMFSIVSPSPLAEHCPVPKQAPGRAGGVTPTQQGFF